jgi:hypothetical protein
MANFHKYLELNKAVQALPDGEQKERLKWSCGQLLHLIQGKEVAKRAWRKYLDEMRDWEGNIVEHIEHELRKLNT